MSETRAGRRRMAVCAVVGLLLALTFASAYLLLRTERYTSDATLYVYAQSGETAAIAYQGSLLSQQRVQSYQQLISSPRVLKEIRTRLGLNESIGDLESRLSASGSVDSTILTVSANETTPEGAAALANSASNALISLVADLETPGPGRAPQVAVRVVAPASLPVSPSSVSPLSLYATASVLGLALGIGSFFVLRSTDRSIRSEEQLEEVSGSSVLASIPRAEIAPDGALAMLSDPTSPMSERTRQLRVTLDYVALSSANKTLMITSAGAGEGKTTTACNLAVALAKSGVRTLLIDADLRRPTVALRLGLESQVGLTSVITGEISPMDALLSTPEPNLKVLTSGVKPPNPSELLSSEQMRSTLSMLRSKFDFVLIDTPPLLPVTDAAALAPITDGVLMVARFGVAQVGAVKQAVANIHAVESEILGFVLTAVPLSDELMAYAATDADDMVIDLGRSPLHTISEDEDDTNQIARPNPIPRPTPRPLSSGRGYNN